MMKIAVLCVMVGCAMAVGYGRQIVEKEFPPTPYDFEYSITDDDGNTNGRQESGDAQGNKKGSYNIQGADGLRRWVEYVADGEGVRMVIRTNEPGTDNQSPADVEVTAEESPVVYKAPRKVVVKEAAPVQYKYVKVPIHGGY